MKYFTIEELAASETARKKRISNIPDKECRENLERLVRHVLDPLRDWYGKPIFVTSGYRSHELNKAVKGACGSQHVKGQAADIVAKSGSDTGKLFGFIRDNLLFDQLIWEKGDDLNPAWIHVSYSLMSNRKEVLKTRDGRNYMRIA